MESPNNQRFKELKSKHQKLYSYWKKEKKPCIICADRFGNGKDHLPPKVLFPKVLRTPKTEFFTYPVCTECNSSSSDEDFLLYTLVAWKANQKFYIEKTMPDGQILQALHDELIHQLALSPKEQERRIKLLSKYTVTKEINGRKQFGIDSKKINVNQTLTKIVKSIYWLHTEGDLLQKHNPAWWIYQNIDASTPSFIDNHLKTTHVDIHWDDKFIVHYTIGQPSDNVGGIISCSLHFYTEKNTKKGMSWFLIALPKEVMINGKSLYKTYLSSIGEPLIKPLP